MASSRAGAASGGITKGAIVFWAFACIPLHAPPRLALPRLASSCLAGLTHRVPRADSHAGEARGFVSHLESQLGDIAGGFTVMQAFCCDDGIY